MDEFEICFSEGEESVSRNKGNRVDNNKEEKNRRIVPNEGDIGRDEVDGSKIDDADYGRCRSCDPETGVEDSAVIL